MSQTLRHIIANWAEHGAIDGDVMCKTCAFRRDSEANMEPHNVDSAIESLAYYQQFNCHIRTGIDAGRMCIGYKSARRYLEANYGAED